LKISRFLLKPPRLDRSFTGETGVDHGYYLGPDRAGVLAAFYGNVMMNTGVATPKGPGVSAADRPGVYLDSS
jgi:hypothetical protein